MNAEYAEKQLEEIMLTPREKCLMSMSFGGEATEEAFRVLTEEINLDTANQNYILMLSCLGYTKGWKYFVPRMIPRLKGVHRYHQVHNSMGIPWLVRQLKKLTEAGIPVMFLKGAALLAYYVPDRPRLMWDYDIAVPVKDFKRAVRLILDAGNTFMQESPHSVSMKGDRDEIDLHHWIFKTYGEQDCDIWERAEAFQFHGIEVHVPSAEDMLIHLLDTQSRNYFRMEGIERRMQWFYDCRRIWEGAGGMDLEHLAARAEELHARERVRMMLRLFIQCFPELADAKEFERHFPRTAAYEKLLITGEKYRQECGRFRAYGYTAESILTPMHIWRTLRVERAIYRYFKPELRQIESRVNFFRYIKMAYCLDSYSVLKDGYLSRLGFFAGKKKEMDRG